MSAYIHLSGPYDRLRIEVDDDRTSIFINSCDDYGLSRDRVSLRLTSGDVAAMRAALDALDTAKADEDLADELEDA